MTDILEGLDRVIKSVERTPQINAAGVRNLIDREFGELTGGLAAPLNKYCAQLGDQVNQAGALVGLQNLKRQYELVIYLQ